MEPVRGLCSGQPARTPPLRRGKGSAQVQSVHRVLRRRRWGHRRLHHNSEPRVTLRSGILVHDMSPLSALLSMSDRIERRTCELHEGVLSLDFGGASTDMRARYGSSPTFIVQPAWSAKRTGRITVERLDGKEELPVDKPNGSLPKMPALTVSTPRELRDAQSKVRILLALTRHRKKRASFRQYRAHCVSISVKRFR